MTALHVEVGDKVIVVGDPMTHVVCWANTRSWDTECGLIVENYQPDYYQSLLEVDYPAMENRLPPEQRGYRGPEGQDFRAQHPALGLRRAPDDALITCLLCLRTAWRLGESAAYDIDAGAPWDAAYDIDTGTPW